MKLDNIDRQILRELQKDSSRSTAEIADRVGLSMNACWRRIKQLQRQGIVRKQVTLLDPNALGLGLTAFVQVRTSQHTEEWFDQFAGSIRQIEEVVEFHRVSGDYDYLLKVIVSDIADYDRVYKRIIKAAPLQDVTSYFSMEKIKETTEIPIPARASD
ncbi:MAG: Lrp/AsnC family transcriptional regulator [Alphaproteobacteria bacterium]|nr:Lrp/AsnC family transcriptional regulator [Alphaproteobacteria bacterium]MCZ6494554.1 Lrp/AsnC family transcriptional regulator [Alphaproteobacteria bacterium]MCZ6741532.1 Lrp/AsnC family transcriptional regulator [Alphaproteobacteria bacterium]MCZ6849189.1 Lrp/AsnC family transcriptional regulator [Alphaproteobacteria bacterium]